MRVWECSSVCSGGVSQGWEWERGGPPGGESWGTETQVHTAQNTLQCRVQCAVCVVQCAGVMWRLCSVLCAVNSEQCAVQCVASSSGFARACFNWPEYTMYSVYCVLCEIYRKHCIVCNIWCTMYSVLYILSNVQCALCSACETIQPGTSRFLENEIHKTNLKLMEGETIKKKYSSILDMLRYWLCRSSLVDKLA